MRRVCIIDNYDSFTYNLKQYVSDFTPEIKVFLNDKYTTEEIEKYNPTHLIISPGPGTVEEPKDTGITFEALKFFENKIPILGVCLGHQAIAKYYGGKIAHAPEVFHGKTSIVKRAKSEIFQELPEEFEVMRYHSLMVSPESLPETLRVTSQTDDNVIMSLEHTSLPIFGIQFHPESIGTPYGKKILENFLKMDILFRQSKG